MDLPVIEAKLVLPQVPASYLPRERLDRLWPQWRAQRLVLVTAGAGFGKTAYSRFVRQHNEAYRLFPGDGHAYDVEEFLSLLKEGQALWQAGERREAEALLTRSIELYRGDFLEESPYEEFAAAHREELRERLVRGLRRLLSLHAQMCRWEETVPLCRRALMADPYLEDFHWHLVQAQLRLGNRVEALADYHSYEERMVRDLGVLPSERMRALADEATRLGTGRPRIAP